MSYRMGVISLKMERLTKCCLFIFAALMLTSCQDYSDGRMLKKFISRFNAEEYPSAATYVYPGDRMNVAFFDKEVKPLAPYSFIKLIDYKTEGEGSQRIIKAKIKWENTTPALEHYFSSIGHPLESDGTQTVELKIRDTTDGETLSFVWGIPDVIPENLWIASGSNPSEYDEDGNELPSKPVHLYSRPSVNSKVVGELREGVIVGQENDNGWFPVYQVDKNGDIITSYLKKQREISLDRTAYFNLGIFDSISVIVALVIIILIIVPLYYVGSVVASIFMRWPIFGPLLCIGLILGLIYVIYQLLEKILFELFIINLPY